MIGRILLILMLLIANTAIANPNNKVCVKGFERLVVLSNAGEISQEEFAETEIIVDSLLRNQCYEYLVDKQGTIYAGASLTYLFGKICYTFNDAAAVKAYVKYLDRDSSFAAEDADNALEILFHQMPEVFISEIFKDDVNAYLLQHIAWGFLNNIRFKYGLLNKQNFKEAFYKRYPSLSTLDAGRQALMDELFTQIALELE